MGGSPSIDWSVIGGLFCAFLFAAIVASVIGGVILRISSCWAEKRVIPYDEAIFSMFIANFVCGGIGFFAVIAMGVSGVDKAWLSPFCIAYVPTCLVLQIVILSWFHKLSFRKGLTTVL